jgi:hypothetical protein
MVRARLEGAPVLAQGLNRPAPLPPGNGATAGTFLVDGLWQGTWHIRDQSLRIQPFINLRPAGHDALLAEAAQLHAFLAPGRIAT